MAEGDDWVIVRVSAVPASWWTDAASPGVFSLVRDLDAAESALLHIGPAVAEAIGERLVPNDAANGDERGRMLTVRRRLHGGRPIDQAELSGVASVARRLDEPALAARLDRCAELLDKMAGIEAELDCRLAAERTRLLAIPGRIASASPFATAIFASDDLPGECTLNRKSWRRFARRWDLVSRAAVVATPRGWFSHVTVLRPRDSSDPPRVGDGVGVCWTESIRELRRSLMQLSMIGEFPAVATNPLSWTEEGYRYAFVLDHLDEPSCVVLPETEYLAALLQAAKRPLTLPELSASLGVTNDHERQSLGEYVGQLLQTGILQGSAPPRMSIRRADPGGLAPSPENEVTATGGWVDVYRDGSAGVPEQMIKDLRERTRVALRFLGGVSTPWRSGYGGPPNRWTVVDVLKATLARTHQQQGTPAAEDPVALPRSLTPSVAELAAFLASQPKDADVIDLPLDLASAIGADDATATWPVDCLLRVPDPSVADHGPVLAEVWPAGTIDSRFADGMREVVGGLPGQAAYREFLRSIEDLTGVRFVEITVPPLSDAADNAVRRPRYTSAWTGDPAAAAYFAGDMMPEEYIPLRDIELIRGPNGYQCNFEGRRLWPCYHATRTFSSPWDNVAHTLLLGSPLAFPKEFRRPDFLLSGLWDTATMPRVVLDGDVVLSPARWRLPSSTFWEPGAPFRERLRALERMRGHVGLPRWVFVSDPEEGARTGVDLESLAALEQINALLKHQTSILVVEMVPTPDELLLADHTHSPASRVTSEFVLRFPADGELGELASQIARGLGQ